MNSAAYGSLTNSCLADYTASIALRVLRKCRVVSISYMYRGCKLQKGTEGRPRCSTCAITAKHENLREHRDLLRSEPGRRNPFKRVPGYPNRSVRCLFEDPVKEAMGNGIGTFILVDLCVSSPARVRLMIRAVTPKPLREKERPISKFLVQALRGWYLMLN